MGKINQEELRQVINKRVSPSDLLLEELNVSNTAGGNYAYLNESIYDASEDNFLGIFTDDIGSTAYSGSYTVDYESAVITFADPVTQALYAKYYGGGSIIWANDINNLNDSVKIIDNNAVYSDGSVVMQGNLNLNTHALTNVTTLNNININTHKHNETDGTPQIDTDGITDLAVTNEKLSTKEDDGIAAVGTINIQDKAVTNNEIADNTILNTKLKDNTIQFSKFNSINVLTNIFNVMYPVGAIYITTSNTCPIAAYLGTWELVSSGRVLQGSDENHLAGTTIEAGLPNIKGADRIGVGGFYDGVGNTSTAIGAFQGARLTTGGRTVIMTKTDQWSVSAGMSLGVVFDASKSNSIYKDDVTTVQPSAYVVNIFKRVS